jgi:hypothetical protein
MKAKTKSQVTTSGGDPTTVARNVASMVPTAGQRIERAMQVIELVRCGLREHGDVEDDGMFREFARALLADAGDGLFYVRDLLDQEGLAGRPAPTPDEQQAMLAVAALAGAR